jgi:hypothetical protein
MSSLVIVQVALSPLTSVMLSPDWDPPSQLHAAAV